MCVGLSCEIVEASVHINARISYPRSEANSFIFHEVFACVSRKYFHSCPLYLVDTMCQLCHCIDAVSTFLGGLIMMALIFSLLSLLVIDVLLAIAFFRK